MIFTCEQEKLMEAVNNLQRAVSAKSSYPALEGIYIKAKETSLFLCGYDLELGITTEIPATISQKGQIVLSAKLFGDIVRRLPDSGVHIEVDEKNITTIKSGESNFSIIGISAEEYPELPKISEENSISLPSQLLKSMIKQTLFAVASTDDKPIHTGILFDFEQKFLTLVSVDGYRLAIRKEQIDMDNNLKIVIPGKTLQEVVKLLPDSDEKIELLIGSRHAMFKTGNYTVISRLLEGDFIDYKSTIPNSSSTEINLNTRELINSVERVSLLITDRLKSPVRCDIKNNQILLSCSTTIGRAKDQISTEITGDSLEIGFNNQYMLDALRNTDSDKVKIQFNGPISPIKILPVEGDSYLFLVLPVRL